MSNREIVYTVKDFNDDRLEILECNDEGMVIVSIIARDGRGTEVWLLRKDEVANFAAAVASLVPNEKGIDVEDFQEQLALLKGIGNLIALLETNTPASHSGLSVSLLYDILESGILDLRQGLQGEG